jgi:hypothetical protein
MKTALLIFVLACSAFGQTAQNRIFKQPSLTWTVDTFTFTNAGETWRSGVGSLIGRYPFAPLIVNRNQMVACKLYYATPYTFAADSFTFANAGETWRASGNPLGRTPYKPCLYVIPTNANTVNTFGGGIIVIP